MALVPVLLFLAAVLHPSLLEDTSSSEDEPLTLLSTTLPEIQEEIVNKHNELRRTVSPSAGNMLKMEWNNDAAINAQTWAHQCKYKHSDQGFRRINMTCGENLFMSSSPLKWSEVIQGWYDEVQDFKYGSGPKTSNAVVGHYTQVVWNTSFRVGCAVAQCPESSLEFFYVCHYCPAGNNVNRLYKPYKDGKPCAECPDDCDNGLCTNSCIYEDSYSNCNELKESLTCDYPLVMTSCKASCKCEGKIY